MGMLARGGKMVSVLLLLSLGLLLLSQPALGALVVVEGSINPVLSMEVVRQDPAVIGEEFTVLYSVKNISDKPAFNLTFGFNVEGIQEGDFQPITLNSEKLPETITMLEEGASASFSVTYKVSPDAQEKVYRLVGRVHVQNASMQDAGSYSALSSVGLTLTSAKPTLTVTDILLPDAEPDLLNGFKIKLLVKNGSLTHDLRNVTFQLDGGENFEVMDISNKKSLTRISTNQTVEVEYTLRAKANRPSNAITLFSGYSYTTGSVDLKENSEALFLPLPTETSGNGTIPRVIIKKYSLSKDQVLAGDRVALTLSIENTNQRSVQNVLVSFGAERITTDSGTSSTTVFSPVNSSNTFHIDEIPGKSTVNKSITFYVDPGATAKTYSMPVTISYEDSRGVPVDAAVNDSVNIPVTQEAKLQIMSVNIPTEAMAGMPIAVTAEFANAGKVDLTEFSVRLEGDFQTQEGSMYLSKLAIGSTNSYAGVIIPEAEGTLSGRLVFSYTDNNNQLVEEARDFSIEIMPMEDPGIDPGMPPLGPDGEPLGPDGQPIGGGGILGFVKERWLPLLLLALVIGQGVYIVRYKKKAKEEFFDE